MSRTTIGTFCDHCWTYYRKKPGHDPKKCRGEWKTGGDRTVCMCNCKPKGDA